MTMKVKIMVMKVMIMIILVIIMMLKVILLKKMKEVSNIIQDYLLVSLLI